MRRFPLRTVLLMAIALLAFLRLYYVTHTPSPPGSTPAPTAAQGGRVVDVTPPSPGRPSDAPSPACRTLAKSLEAAIRAPDNAKAVAEAGQQLEACPTMPARACELGAALDARAPLSAGASPLRGLLEGLCQRCASGDNPCAWVATRSLLVATAGRDPDLEELRWNLERAGPGTASACDTFVRTALVSAAQAPVTLKPSQRAVLGVAAPPCAKAGALPAAVLHAAAVQQGAQAPELAKLAATPPGTPGPLKPDQVTGAEAGRNAYDGSEKSGVDLGNAPTGRDWPTDGALRAQFAPPLKQLASLRVRASGPGTLRAIVRTPPGIGLEDAERGMSFVHPTACRFKGTGQWETCKLEVPLLEVDAVSVFPEQPKISLYEVEVLGAR